jgi:hypothetical protein
VKTGARTSPEMSPGCRNVDINAIDPACSMTASTAWLLCWITG